MSQQTSKAEKRIWGSVLGVFAVIILSLGMLLLRDGKIIFYSVTSIITGLIAWSIPIIDKAFLKKSQSGVTTLLSIGFAFLAVWMQFLDIKNLAYTGNWSAIYDTITVLAAVVLLFYIITLILNYMNIRKNIDRNKNL